MGGKKPSKKRAKGGDRGNRSHQKRGKNSREGASPRRGGTSPSASKPGFAGPLEQIDEFCWRIPQTYKAGMEVEGRIFADEKLIRQIRADQAPEQVANVAFLPGIQEASLAMPDIHSGYGFCIGGVCATDPAEGGVISPGGVGYDINCGVRLVRTDLESSDIRPRIAELMEALFQKVPAGVGVGGPYAFDAAQMRRLLGEGARFLERQGLATAADLEHTEAGGCMADADPDRVSERAVERGDDQCGTLGSGNHFVEVQVVDEIFDLEAARVMGLEQDAVCVMIHSGSRGLGFQVCDDALRDLRNVPRQYGIHLPDRQLACAPVESPEGERYLGAMRAAANFAWANRQLLMWQTREVFEAFLGPSWESMNMDLVYDVAHNIAKFEQHEVGGHRKQLCVHRKGATRAFPPQHPELPNRYQPIGQPVIIPGDMGRTSWVLVGQPGSMERSFGSSCHGAGRVMSRKEAIRQSKGRRIDLELAEQGVIARCRSRTGLAEEQPAAYKDADLVVDVVHRAGLASKVARLRPLGVVKG